MFYVSLPNEIKLLLFNIFFFGYDSTPYLYINGFDTVNYRLLEGDPTFVIVQQILFLEINLLWGICL